MTIGSDDEGPVQSTKVKDEVVRLDADFVFDPFADALADTSNKELDLRDFVKTGSRPVRTAGFFGSCLVLTGAQEPISVDDIIERRKQSRASKKRKRAPVEVEEEGYQSSNPEAGGGDDQGSDESEFAMLVVQDTDDPLASSDEEGRDPEVVQSDAEEEHKDGGDSEQDGSLDSSENSDEEETQVEKDRKVAFFADDSGPSEKHDSFLGMNLSRPILKALTSLGFATPTPIQSATIPVALLGKDVVGNAVTGSGKTAAFIVPMIERLLYRERGRGAAATRCLILVPTRELGVQCYEVGKKLSAYTDIRFCLTVGTISSGSV